MTAAKLISAFLILSGSICASALAAPGTIDDLMRGGDIVVDQQPALLGGFGSDTLFRDYLGYEVWQREADNVLLGQDATIRRVVWWGFYGAYEQSNNPPVGDETMRIRFYAARPGDGLPDEANILYEGSFLNPQRTATGRYLPVDYLPAEYRYETNLGRPVNLAAGSLWWIEIVQIGDLESHYRWETASGILTGHAFASDQVPEWRFSSSGSFALQLSTIPEPCTASIIVVLTVLLAARRRGRSAHKQVSLGDSEPNDA